MGSGSVQAIDYTNRKILKARLREAQKYGVKLRQHGLIWVSYSKSFDKFAANTAYILRGLMKYRSDNGRFARGLVRASGDLEELHRYYTQNNTREGARIRLYALLIRRKTIQAHNRWVLNIEFSLPVSDAEFRREVILVPNPEIKAESFINDSLLIAQDIPGQKGRRIVAYLEIADRLGWPKFLDLWYYHPAAVLEFNKASEKKREQMLTDGGGKFPLKGKLKGQYQNEAGRPTWRIYPFRTLVQNMIGEPDESVKTVLMRLDERIGESISNLRTGANISGSETGEGKIWRDFRKHFRELATRKIDHLYYQWSKNTKDD